MPVMPSSVWILTTTLSAAGIDPMDMTIGFENFMETGMHSIFVIFMFILFQRP
jgi:hypothetical protein